MWWYKNTRPEPSPRKERPGAAVPAEPAQALAAAVAHALDGRPRDPDALLVMSLLVDSRVELAGGTVYDGMTWHEAERTISDALGPGDPVRLYNRFAREFGDGYSSRESVAPAHAEALTRLRGALATAPGVRTITVRSARPADAPVA